MALNFDHFATEAATFMKKYAKKLQLEDDMSKAGRVLSSVLHGLREIISTEESLQLLAQLPMFLKAVYVNGWTTHIRRNKIKKMSEFIELIRDFNGVTAWHDFESDAQAKIYINNTFKLLRMYISLGELEDIRSELPKDLKSIIYKKMII
ncbi:Uncharacterized conserved protein, DUF2267 family [Lutibacter agarilyticus]|uniref:Uncharacterized conserved protein, DUF2267 family n=1 Tax=Lutibacter agarilyticus TaxID=1109740 RepID=A0A238YPC3_9FLAO|nr:DUF2267 domain-containing protein [Lutibacter agarilyticus]SNR72279.1 Uncharacterized conserved protein, DUF2267 family [Lutibacter agarilyticus]